MGAAEAPRPPFPPDWNIVSAEALAAGAGGEVWQVRGADGAAGIAKRVSDKALPEAAQGAAFLRWRDGHGAVRLLAEHGSWQLLEHAGSRLLLDVLSEKGDEHATALSCAVLKRLHAPSALPPPPTLQPLHERFAGLFAIAASSRTRSALLRDAAALAQRLLSRQIDVRPLHGDLHHENILLGRRGWLAIDPHGLSGDPAYDAANLFYNPVERQALRTDPARIRRMAALLSAGLGRSEETLLGYAVAHACLSASWHLEDGNGAEAGRSLEVAEALRRVLASPP